MLYSRVAFMAQKMGSVGLPVRLQQSYFPKKISWDNYKDYTYVGTLDGLYQHTLIATGTRLRPVEATFLGHILGTKPAHIIRI